MNSTKALPNEPTKLTEAPSGGSVSALPKTSAKRRPWLDTFRGIHGGEINSGRPLCEEPTKLTEAPTTWVALIAERHGQTLAELKEVAGPDWLECERDPALLEALASAVQTRRMREKGIVPPSYTAVTVCAGCGHVPIFEGVAERVEGCPWCLNRVAGKPVPRAVRKSF